MKIITSGNYVEAAVRTECSYERMLNSLAGSRSLCRRLHAAIGLCTEAGELYLNLLSKRSTQAEFNLNLKEELSDLCWYIAIIADTFGMTMTEVFVEATKAADTREQPFADASRQLVVDVGEFQNCLKRILFYGKEISDADQKALFLKVVGSVLGVATYYGVDVEQVLQANIAKLSARYPDKFTEFAAENRDIAKEQEVLKQS